ncbi:unnamed protein product [Dovyalis caffra]|uniref:Uncharacterized protein n=1 Tax=Dovyalis caffra TaxID=77055 RepID=A0AAV1SRY5_9ROSI|nr:unnamed protein product [Dovyalis caffra]
MAKDGVRVVDDAIVWVELRISDNWKSYRVWVGGSNYVQEGACGGVRYGVQSKARHVCKEELTIARCGARAIGYVGRKMKACGVTMVHFSRKERKEKSYNEGKFRVWEKEE